MLPAQTDVLRDVKGWQLFAVVGVAVLFTITMEAAVKVVEVERSFFHILDSEASASVLLCILMIVAIVP